jgi:hypothetical protein
MDMTIDDVMAGGDNGMLTTGGTHKAPPFWAAARRVAWTIVT